MSMYEYHEERLNTLDKKERLERLNELGKQGWKLVNIIDGVFFFRRGVSIPINYEIKYEPDIEVDDDGIGWIPNS